MADLSKRNNQRRNPGIKGVRPDNKSIKVEEAKARLEAWQKLSPQDQLAILKTRPGKSQKQIARIEKHLADVEAKRLIDETIASRKEKKNEQ